VHRAVKTTHCFHIPYRSKFTMTSRGFPATASLF